MHLILYATIFALSLFAANAAQALDLPARKPGLWDIKMVFEGRDTPPHLS